MNELPLYNVASDTNPIIRFECPNCKQISDMPIRSALLISLHGNPYLRCTGCKKHNPVDYTMI